jgi:hypothetical protein
MARGPCIMYVSATELHLEDNFTVFFCLRTSTMSRMHRKRVRGGLGAVDPLSDEETEIDISAASLASGGIKYSYTKTTFKRTKPNAHSTSQLPSILPSNLASNSVSSEGPAPLISSPGTKSKEKETGKCPQVWLRSESL